MSLTIEDFSLLSVIGKGTYAKVLLVRHIKSDQVYAMKVLKKKYIAEKKQEFHIQTQREILANVDHPFLMKLHYSFQDAKKLYFVLEYCPGGQLFGLLQLKNSLSEEQTKFYTAQILLALEALHDRNVIYRDLKPQNILLDTKGYVKLTDFGLSKILTKDESAMSICGTPEYLAPEIINREGHGKAVDWWCLGCLIFEMITGYPPFDMQNRNQLFQAIRTMSPKIPADVLPMLNQISPKLNNLLLGLLEKNPKKRLGFNGPQQVKKHPWFEKTNWGALLTRAIKAPFVPIINSECDISNFDVEFTSTEIESFTEGQSLTQQPKYFGFSYENEEAA